MIENINGLNAIALRAFLSHVLSYCDALAELLHIQVTQTMQIPLSYAEDIIGVGGVNIGYIRRTSGATLTVQESRGLPDEITVEIKGTSSQVQTAQRLIQVRSSSSLSQCWRSH